MEEHWRESNCAEKEDERSTGRGSRSFGWLVIHTYMTETLQGNKQGQTIAELTLGYK